MRVTSLQDEPVLLADAEPGFAGANAPATGPSWVRGLRRWWSRQVQPRVEDEAVEREGISGVPIRQVVPLLLPLLAVAGILLLREPDNVVAATCLFFGATAIIYGLAADQVERRVTFPSRVQLVSTAVYAVIISVELWCFLILDHPRPYTHWIIFLLYFLLIGAAGLTDDPRQPVCAGLFSILGYGVVVALLVSAAESGSSEMAGKLAPEFDWVVNGAKVALLAGVTFTGWESAHRGRAVRRMSLRDGLTGLLNRHAFDRCLDHLATRARHRGVPMTIAMIDIDHFKRLNDAHGHPTGDAVLRWVAAWLQRSFRSTDVVSRYGGEEFVVAFVDTDPAASATLGDRLEALRAGIEGTRLRTLGDDSEIRVTVSMGVAHLPGDGSNVEEVLARADERLYLAKTAGRNCIVTTDGAKG